MAIFCFPFSPIIPLQEKKGNYDYIYAGEDLPEEEKNASDEVQKPGFRIPPESDPPVRCDACGLRLQDYFDGKTLIKAADLAERSNRLNGRVLCPKCTKKERSNAG